MQEKQLHLYEDLIEVKQNIDRLSKRIGKITERFSELVERGQPAHNNARDEILLCAEYDRDCNHSTIACNAKKGSCPNQRKTSPVA